MSDTVVDLTRSVDLTRTRRVWRRVKIELRLLGAIFVANLICPSAPEFKDWR